MKNIANQQTNIFLSLQFSNTFSRYNSRLPVKYGLMSLQEEMGRASCHNHFARYMFQSAALASS